MAPKNSRLGGYNRGTWDSSSDAAAVGASILGCFLIFMLLAVVRIVTLIIAITDLAQGRTHIALDIILIVLAW
jgi:hypothetical protein